jgi:hypothetical protein
MPPARLQRWLNAMVITAVLDRVRDENDEPIFLLKGGLSMELRLRLRARVTTDYDTAFRARADQVMNLLDEALARPWNSFEITRDAPEKVPNTAANCVSLRYQVAQKLHACTEVFESGRENDRFRDVMDILLVDTLLHEVGLSRVRAACVDIFNVRDKHAWPPTVAVYDSWRAPFAALARENRFTPEDIDQAAAALTDLIAAIDAAADDVDIRNPKPMPTAKSCRGTPRHP